MKRLLLLDILLAIAFVGCTKFEEPERITETPKPSATEAKTRATITAFSTLPDPFSLANMQAVYRNYGTNRTLQATHKYVRFKPQTQEQLDQLEDVYDLDLYDYPLDMEIPDGVEYVDPTIPEGEPIWYYTTVPTNFVFPQGIQKEIIRECYIPADEEVINIPAGTRAGESGTYSVEELAFFNLGYLSDPLTRSGGDGGFRPEGTVTVLDNSAIPLNHVVVKGVRIKVNSHTKIDKVYTDANGHYRMNKKFWQEELKYKVVFRNTKDFIIWEGFGNRAKYKPGTHHKSGWDISIADTTSRAWMWATVNNAAYEYYEMCNQENIRKPPSGLRILVQPDAGASSAPMIRRIAKERLFTKTDWVAFIRVMAEVPLPSLMNLESIIGKFLEPDVTIGTSGYTYAVIYNTVNHELSHASHYNQVNNDYWANYIAYIINCFLGNDNNTYGDGSRNYAGNTQVGEMWGHAMGDIQMSEKYNPARRNDVYNDVSYAGTLYRFTHPGDGGWIHPDPIWALITRGVLTKKQVFDCLTSDVDTRAKLIAKMTSKYPTKAQQINVAFAANDVPIIEGPDKPSLNTLATYNIPASLADDIDFTGWTVTGGTYTTTGGLTNPTLNVRLTQAVQYTLTANFALSGGGTYAATKTVNLTPLPPPPPPPLSYPTPVVAVDYIAGGQGPGGVVKVFVQNYRSDLTYEWDVIGETDLTQGDGLWLGIPDTPPTQGWYVAASCRGIEDGYPVTGWSNRITVSVDYSAQYSMSLKDSLAMKKIMLEQELMMNGETVDNDSNATDIDM